LGLMLLCRVSIPEHHLDAGVSQHRRRRDDKRSIETTWKIGAQLTNTGRQVSDS
jgi:hypothetical protein